MSNRLHDEPSPYLQQHAANPVDWYPWGPEALERARREDKPILLSVGYSACHWCHVMAHECFEDADVAAVMNRHFINIKVDREERPDLDQLYQSAHQLLARKSGGWPLTVFLTPDTTPFYAGTYFPKTPRHQLPGFITLMDNVARAWQEKRTEILQQNEALRGALADGGEPAASMPAAMSERVFARAVADLADAYDPKWGGFSRPPKFPRPGELQFLLREFSRSGDVRAREMALHTLRQLASGGVRDQLGGGFCRYSVDANWTIPHFEKMLYDNGPLLGLYADAWCLTGGADGGEALFRETAEQLVEWLLREMAAPDGGFYAALDADSEGHEGRFYVWTPDAVAALLSPEEAAIALPVFGFDGPANFEGEYWNPVLARPLAEVAAACGCPLDSAQTVLAQARAKLFTARATRVRPGCDDKRLTSWNALMIAGLARAGRLMQRRDWIDAAQAALDFLRAALWQDGRLRASYKHGTARLNAYLDDYAFVLDALFESLQAAFRPDDLAWAQAIADALLAHFEDPERGGFFFTSHDHEVLIARQKPAYDHATPSGNGVAALALQRFGSLLGEPRYSDAARRTLALFQPSVEQHPVAYPGLLAVLDEALAPPRRILVRGPAVAVAAAAADLARRSDLRTQVLALPNGLALPAALARPDTDFVQAWVCEGMTCHPPVTDWAEL